MSEPWEKPRYSDDSYMLSLVLAVVLICCNRILVHIPMILKGPC